MIDRIQRRLFWVSLGILMLILLEHATKDEAARLTPKPFSPVEKSPRAAAPTPTKTDSSSDDFTRLEGIGPKVRDALRASGITSFAQIAAMSGEELYRLVHDEHNVRIVGDATKTWPKQAQFIVNGDLDGLKTYQDRLIGGREPHD